MAVRALICLALVLAVFSPPADACFGPKLYVAAVAEPRQQALVAVATLYVREKTGVESAYVALGAGADPLAELSQERADLVCAAVPSDPAGVLLAVPGYPALVGGTRVFADLQFTTVAPALRKLGGLLTPADLSLLTAQIVAGEPPLAAARRLLMERRWI